MTSSPKKDAKHLICDGGIDGGMAWNAKPVNTTYLQNYIIYDSRPGRKNVAY